MFVNVGRFHFQPMSDDERRGLVERFQRDIPPAVRASQGFRSVRFVRVDDDEIMTVWAWDSEADWDSAFAAMGPMLQEYVIPNLAGPPERVGGEVIIDVEV